MAERAIFKWTLPVSDEPSDLAVPGGGRVVHVAEQHGEPTVWIECRPDLPPISKRLLVVGTGHPVPDYYAYRGAALCGPFVWHVLEWEPF